MISQNIEYKQTDYYNYYQWEATNVNSTLIDNYVKLNI